MSLKVNVVYRKTEKKDREAIAETELERNC